MRFTIDQIAKVTHETNRAYCAALGDNSQLPWEDAPEWQKESARMGVGAKLGDMHKSPREMHAAWMAHKFADGWTYGTVKDAEKKTHPCIVPYEQLPVEQRVKDTLFSRVVEAMSLV